MNKQTPNCIRPSGVYSLISPSLDRFYLVSNEYRVLKILQLCVMRNELFYIVDLHKLNISTLIDNSNCLEYTLSNARRLHLELDVEIKKLKYSTIVKKINPPTDVELALQAKIFFCYDLLNQIEKSYQKYYKILNSNWTQEMQGLEITKSFIKNIFNDQDFLKIVDRDIQEISFATKDLSEFRNQLLTILAFIDYDQPIDVIKTEIREQIEKIDTSEHTDALKEFRAQRKITDTDLFNVFIAKDNYQLAQQVLKEKFKSILLLLTK